ncbi:GrpB family protein [Undibacterium sp.]|uniref:GrpB family protein n=1 Tax=Undibacterium sp. TaxID=1914977 RepID=UPI00375079D8
MKSNVIIRPYSEEWPHLFEKIRQELLTAFSPDSTQIEHIGSTAVVGLCAKPVIDVLLGTNSLNEIESQITSLDTLGFGYVSKYEQDIPTRRYFVKSSSDSLRIHVHGVEIGSRIWCEHLKFRDLLRTDAQLRSEYQQLKLRLAAQYADDKSAYTDAKEPFIKSVLEKIRR